MSLWFPSIDCTSDILASLTLVNLTQSNVAQVVSNAASITDASYMLGAQDLVNLGVILHNVADNPSLADAELLILCSAVISDYQAVCRSIVVFVFCFDDSSLAGQFNLDPDEL